MVADPNPSRVSPVGVTAPADLTLTERLRDRLARLVGDLEEGELPPTEAATGRCTEMLLEAADRMSAGRRLPFPHFSSGGQGDLSCEWRVEDRIVLLFISARGDTCLYQMTLGGAHVATRSTIESPSVEEIVAALEWLKA
jgi:hypothetical protein